MLKVERFPLSGGNLQRQELILPTVSDKDFREAGLRHFGKLNSEELEENRPNEQFIKTREIPTPPLNCPVSIDYDGIMSQRMVWSKERLQGFAKTSDLRSHVTILRGSDDPPTEYESQGEILVWKRPFDILGASRKRSHLSNPGEVTISFGAAEAEIYIHDRILEEQVRKEDRGQFNEYLFIEKINRLVRQGLKKILAKEKSYQLVEVCGSEAIIVLINGIPTFISASSFTLAVTDTFKNYLVDLGLILVGGAMGAYEVGLARSTVDKISLLKEKIQTTGYEYVRSLKDLIPLKHVSDFLAGNIYLATKGRNIVSHNNR